jgi:hypothetical protein
LKTSPITPERARELVDVILVEVITGCYDDAPTAALIELIAGVCDIENAHRTDERADAALNALMQAYTYTSSFHNNLCDHLASQGKGMKRGNQS